MSYPISHKMSTLKPSVIREILKYSSDPDVISFAAGNPASETFPVEKIAAITADILQKDPTAALQYSLSEGYPALRTTLERWLAQDYGIDFSENTLLITSGAQQGIDLVTKCLCDEGDTVLVEKPTFIGALNTFRSYGVQLAPVELEDDGLSLASLRSAWEMCIRDSSTTSPPESSCAGRKVATMVQQTPKERAQSTLFCRAKRPATSPPRGKAPMNSSICGPEREMASAISTPATAPVDSLPR